MSTDDKNILAYRFYRRNWNGEDQLIGTLTERRKKTKRITHFSIMNWVRNIAFKDVFEERVYFIQVEIKSEEWLPPKLNNIEASISKTA